MTIIPDENQHRLELDIRDRLTRIETKLDWNASTMLAMDGRITDHESRLRMLERRMWTTAGAAAVFGAIGGTIAGFVFNHL